jgi:hypothetical protein
MEPDPQLDLACLAARLRQIESEGYAEGHWLMDRVITCDLPRLWRILTPEMKQLVIEAEE